MSNDPTATLADPDSIATTDVRRQLRLVWAQRTVIMSLAVLCGAAGALFSVVRTRQFEAAVTVSVSAARLGDQTPGRVPPEAFVPLMTTPAVASAVVRELAIPRLTALTLLDSVITVRGVPDSSFIKIVARMSDPDLAARTANTFATHAVAAATRAGRIDVEAIESELKRMLDEATERLRAAEKAYDDYRVSARVEMLEREVETLVEQRGELMDVLVELAGERARLARLDSELEKRDRVTSLKQSVVNDPAATEVARNAGGNRDLLGVQMTRETSNAVFENLDEEAAKARAHVASLDQQRLRLGAAAGLNGDQLSRMTQLYERQSMLERLDSEREIARKSYENVANKYQGSRLASVGRTPQLLVVDPAMAPEDALGRYTARNTLLGITVGILIGCVWAMLRHALAGQAAA